MSFSKIEPFGFIIVIVLIYSGIAGKIIMPFINLFLKILSGISILEECNDKRQGIKRNAVKRQGPHRESCRSAPKLGEAPGQI